MKTVVPTTLDIARESGWSGENEPKDFVGALKLLSNHIGPASPEAVTEAVNDWLDGHPEALVADGSVTTEKLADGAVTEEKLGVDLGDAPERVAELQGNQLTGELSGTIDTAADAYAAPCVALAVEGNSTQAGTPTPDAPIEIQSVENPVMTFVGKNWLDVHAGRKTNTSVAKDGSGVWYPYAVSNYLNNFSGNSLSIDGDTVTFASKANYGFGVETHVLPDATYTFSAQSITVSDGAEYEMRVAHFRKDGTLTYRTLGANVNRVTTTIPSNVIYAIFTISVSANVVSTITVKGLQLELGSTATAYEPHQGTTVPDLLPEGTSLRSLPDGTKDELHLAYLKPSTREGWAWYGAEVTRAVGVTTLDGTQAIALVNWRATATSTGFAYSVDAIPNRYDTLMSDKFQKFSYDDLYYSRSDAGIAHNMNLANYGLFVRVPDPTLTTKALVNTWLAENPVTVQYKLQTPTTETLNPIELPTLPAPNCTVWCDGGSATPTYQMEYVQDTNIVIANMQAMLDDLATS